MFCELNMLQSCLSINIWQLTNDLFHFSNGNMSKKVLNLLLSLLYILTFKKSTLKSLRSVDIKCYFHSIRNVSIYWHLGTKVCAGVQNARVSIYWHSYISVNICLKKKIPMVGWFMNIDKSLKPKIFKK